MAGPSGGMPVSVLNGVARRANVLYWLQAITKLGLIWALLSSLLHLMEK